MTDRYERIRAIASARAERRNDESPPTSRIGPTEPDDTMVICPVCTSQFRAIPLDVQRDNESLRNALTRARNHENRCD